MKKEKEKGLQKWIGKWKAPAWRVPIVIKEIDNEIEIKRGPTRIPCKIMKNGQMQIDLAKKGIWIGTHVKSDEKIEWTLENDKNEVKQLCSVLWALIK